MSEQIAILLDATRVSAVSLARDSAIREFALDDSLEMTEVVERVCVLEGDGWIHPGALRPAEAAPSP